MRSRASSPTPVRRAKPRTRTTRTCSPCSRRFLPRRRPPNSVASCWRASVGAKPRAACSPCWTTTWARAASSKKKAAKAARFVSFREDDGSFRFRLLAADGEQLLLSRHFADGKAAGAVTKQLQAGQALDIRSEAGRFSVWLEGECVADSAEFADEVSRDAAIEALRVALTPAQD